MTISKGANGDGNRESNGRFRPGWSGGPGNPKVAHMAELQEAARSAITPQDLTRVLHKLRDLALEGDVAAAKVLLDRVLGKPTETHEVDLKASVDSRVIPMDQRMRDMLTALALDPEVRARHLDDLEEQSKDV